MAISTGGVIRVLCTTTPPKKNKNANIGYIRRDWGVDHITFVSMLTSQHGLERAAQAWPEGTEFVIGAIDPELDDAGYIKPGIGDIGDRLFGTGPSQ